MKNLAAKTALGFAQLLVCLAALLFLPAWTIHYWQAWVYLFAFAASSAAITLYLWKKDRALLERRRRPRIVRAVPDESGWRQSHRALRQSEIQRAFTYSGAVAARLRQQGVRGSRQQRSAGARNGQCDSLLTRNFTSCTT